MINSPEKRPDPLVKQGECRALAFKQQRQALDGGDDGLNRASRGVIEEIGHPCVVFLLRGGLGFQAVQQNGAHICIREPRDQCVGIFGRHVIGQAGRARCGG